ncbi:hypothetical protein [Massilia timonae]|uniref:hypothetical protein n=1 Tax=Massilia timonae TaxID=47229 RepID=UPI0028D08075|nr:hypothetical protein [Massilia timonae]
MNADLVFSFQEFLKVAPGLAIFPLTAYLAWKKIGVSVSFFPTLRNDGNGARISTVVLVNNKDRPVVITGLVAVCDQVRFDLDKFDSPLVLKAYESIMVEPRAHSFFSLHNKEIEPSFSGFMDMQLYIKLPHEYYPCIPVFKKSRFWRRGVRAKYHARGHRMIFNDKLYNPSKVKYAVEYKVDGTSRTTFIGTGGIIRDSDGLAHNFLSPSSLSSPEAALSALQRDNPGMEIAVTDLNC